jgi:transcriptional regulator with XRE-family HTH domain
MKTLKERYLYLIKEKDVTPYQISEKTGISNTALSQIKLGKVNSISNTTAKLLSEYFCVNKDWLLKGEGEMRKSYNQKIGKATDSTIVQGDANNINADQVSLGYQKIIAEFQSQQQQFLDIISNLTKK